MGEAFAVLVDVFGKYILAGAMVVFVVAMIMAMVFRWVLETRIMVNNQKAIIAELRALNSKIKSARPAAAKPLDDKKKKQGP
ncbi:MAG: hypothetical protein JXA04_01385 [Gammaproteobacteria bacterium]|nr:hypothetical protein [Gammaproteobacteria bacterium]